MKLCIGIGWNEEEEGTKLAEGVKLEEAVGTKLLEEALKGLLDTVVVANGAAEAPSIGLDGSLHVETSVDPDADCGEFRSENCDWAAK